VGSSEALHVDSDRNVPGRFIYLSEHRDFSPFCSVQGTMIVMYYIYFNVARRYRGQNEFVHSDNERKWCGVMKFSLFVQAASDPG